MDAPCIGKAPSTRWQSTHCALSSPPRNSIRWAVTMKYLFMHLEYHRSHVKAGFASFQLLSLLNLLILSCRAMAALQLVAALRVHKTLRQFWRRQIRCLLMPNTLVGPFSRPLVFAVVGNQWLYTCRSHGCTEVRDTTTKIVHYRNWDGRLHPLAENPGKVKSDHKSSVQYQKWFHPRSSSIYSLLASISTNRL